MNRNKYFATKYTHLVHVVYIYKSRNDRSPLYRVKRERDFYQTATSDRVVDLQVWELFPFNNKIARENGVVVTVFIQHTCFV